MLKEKIMVRKAIKDARKKGEEHVRLNFMISQSLIDMLSEEGYDVEPTAFIGGDGTSGAFTLITFPKNEDEIVKKAIKEARNSGERFAYIPGIVISDSLQKRLLSEGYYISLTIGIGDVSKNCSTTITIPNSTS